MSVTQTVVFPAVEMLNFADWQLFRYVRQWRNQEDWTSHNAARLHANPFPINTWVVVPANIFLVELKSKYTF